MKLHQLRYLAAVVQNGLNITTAARKLHTSQPGVSKQLKLLEDELGFPLFERDGRNLTRVTAAGRCWSGSTAAPSSWVRARRCCTTARPWHVAATSSW
jgi:hypothetical protein